MCKQLGISHAAYYKWLHRTIPEQESENTKLAGNYISVSSLIYMIDFQLRMS